MSRERLQSFQKEVSFFHILSLLCSVLPDCEHCRTVFTNECSVHGPAIFVPDTPVPMGVADRAVRTLPPGLEVQTSGIPDAGLGVFNKGETIPVGVHFGPYEGDLVDREEAMNSGYSWVVSSIQMYFSRALSQSSFKKQKKICRRSFTRTHSPSGSRKPCHG